MLLHIKIYTYLLILIFGLSTSVYSNTSLDFNSIPTIFNTDSMEKLIPNIKKLDRSYIDHLIILEQSRNNVLSAKFGKYANEIDSLSEIINYPFGKACGLYFKSARNISISPNYVGATIQFAENALQIFKELHDEAGMFYAKYSLIIIYIYNTKGDDLLYYSNNNVNFYKNQIKTYIEKKRQYMFENYIYAKKQKSTKYLIKFINCIVIDYVFSKDEALKKLINKEKILSFKSSWIKMIQENDEVRYQLAYQYNLLSSIHDGEQSIQYLKVAFQQETHHESYIKSIIAKNIIEQYDIINRKLYRDSILRYINIDLKISKQFDTIKKIYNVGTNNLLALLHAEKLNYKDAYIAQIEATKDLEELNKHSQNIVTDSYLEFEKYKIQKTENIKNEFEKSQLFKIIIIILIFIIILTILTILLIYQNKTIKKSNIEIEKLQLARTKFFNIITHDLQNPIKSYQGLASKISYLLKKGMYNEIKEISDKIDTTGLHLDNLFQNLINWGLTLPNFNIMNIKKFNPHDNIINLLLIYENIIHEKKLQLTLKSDKNITLTNDENYFSVILRNLLDNAIKNSQTNSTIQINLLESDEYVEFYLKNASEISAEKFSTILALFHSKKEWQVGEQGLGLGLILIKEFTKKMGGQVELNKTANEISFIIKLPKKLNQNIQKPQT